MLTERTIRKGLAAALLLGATTVVGTASAESWTPITNTVNIGGTVHEFLNTTWTPAIGLGDLVIYESGADVGEKIVKLGDLTTETNNYEGLTLTMTAGLLDHPDNEAGQEVTILVRAVDDGVVPVFADFAGASGVFNIPVQGENARDLYIAYDPPHYLEPGLYAGMVTLTVTAVN